MRLTKLTLFSCPLMLAALVLVSRPAEANSPVSLVHSSAVETTIDHHALALAVAPPADRPLIPTGCSCARCTRTEELLHGQFPAF